MMHAGWKIGDFISAIVAFVKGIQPTTSPVLLTPSMISAYWYKGVIGISTNGWRVLSKSADLDYHIFFRFKSTLNKILYHNLRDLI